MRTEIQLSPKAVETVNELLSSGSRVQLDYDPRSGELKIYEWPYGEVFIKREGV